MWKSIKEFFGVYEKPAPKENSSTVTVNVKVPENTVATVTTKAPAKTTKTTTKAVATTPKKRGPKKKAKRAAK